MMNSSLEIKKRTINAHVIVYYFIYSKTNLYVLSTFTINFNLYCFCHCPHKNYVWFVSCMHKPFIQCRLRNGILLEACNKKNKTSVF
jgi:hypothetical protein